MSSKLAQTHRQGAIITGEPVVRGKLFVVSSPSGGGKGTLIERVLRSLPDLRYSISYTTRTPRNGEVNGREYFFVTPEQFEQMVAANDFLEWAKVHGNYYGSSARQVTEEINEGHDIVLEVDVQGAASIRNLVTDSVSIFILPPSYEVLRQRLLARGTDSDEELRIRLRNAPEEISHYRAFDYVIINDDVERAADRLSSIIEAERSRRERQELQVKQVFETFPLN